MWGIDKKSFAMQEKLPIFAADYNFDETLVWIHYTVFRTSHGIVLRLVE